MDITARLNFLRIAPRKVRAIAEQLRGLSLDEAESQLMISKRRAAGPFLKLFKSAVANAQNNFSIKKDDLLIKKIDVNEGPTLHRWFPRAFGRAAPINKRSSHLLIVLGAKDGVKLNKKEQEKIQKGEDEIVKKEEKNQALTKEGGVKKSSEKKINKRTDRTRSNKKGFARKIFSRKTI